jgi:hypothetical protein
MTAAASTAPSYTPFITDLTRLGRVLFSPTAVFEEQREKPAIWMPWVVISVLSMIVNLTLLRPYGMRMMELATEASGRTAAQGVAAIALAFQVVFTPIMFFVLAAISAGVMYLTLMVAGGEARYSGLLSAAIFSEAAVVLQLVVQWVVLTARGGVGALTGPADFGVGLGLNLLLPADTTLPRFIQGVLSGIGPLQIWALIITAFGVATLEKQTKPAAWTAAVASYLLLVILGAIFFGRGMGG